MATSDKNRRKFSLPGMGEAMLSLIDKDTAPDCISIIRGDVVCTMGKVTTSTGEVYYTGIPTTTNGGKCKFGFTLSCDGYFQGSAAMNFIAAGGWKRGTKKPTPAEKAAARNDFVLAFLSAAIQHRNAAPESENGLAGLKRTIEDKTGLEVVEGEMTPEDVRSLALMQVPFYLIEMCKSHSIKLVLNIPKYISRLVQPQYAKCEKGDWDHESGQVAITSALSAAQAQLMQEAGYRFRKVRYSVKAASPDKQKENK